MPRNIKSKPFSEINVTPFVDVMLVLLIIFMVTAPLLTVGVQVDLPESNADSLQADNEPLELTISKDGSIFIQETEINIKELIPKLIAITDNRLDTKIYVRGDEIINYGKKNVKYIGRRPSASTATGNLNKHLAQQKEILDKVVGKIN